MNCFLGCPHTPKYAPGLYEVEDGVEVKWQNSGNRNCDTYEVEYSIAGSATWQKQHCDGNSISCIVRELQPGQRYIFRISAYNAAGQSAPSPESVIVYLGK